MRGLRLLAAFALALAAAAAVVGSEGSAVLERTPVGPSTHAWLHRVAKLDARGARRLRNEAWWGGEVTAFTGERVRVFISATYPRDDAVARRWANALASLLHGSELSLVRAYIAPHPEVETICGRKGVLGCYGGQELVTTGEPVQGVSAEEVLAHEYGHHVAANRQNPPWSAVHWGPKRWASYANVCARTAAGTAFPGDQGLRYELNPGEAFAEAYRVLNAIRAGSPSFTWDLADVSFRPNEDALAAVEADVARPWTQPPTRLVRARFVGKATSWTTALATPLDGDVTITLRTSLGTSHTVELRSLNRRIVARALWSGSGEQTLTYRVCGERSVLVRVVRHAGGPRFTLRMNAPAFGGAQ
jgi:hypothetical protein